MKICVYGSASDSIADIYKEKVFELGKALALRGHSLVFGGGSNGLMGAAARGVSAVGGEILGIIPKFFEDDNIEKAYSQCTCLINTRTMHDRKELLEVNSDAFIITPGGIGTFDEFFSVLTNKQLNDHNKPIAVFNINNYFNELEAVVKASTEKKFIKENCSKLYKVCSSIDQILDYFDNYNGERLSDLKEG